MLWYKDNGVWIKLPTPDEITVNDEIIWSSNTGRSGTGKMIGDVIAEKVTLGISWKGLRTAFEYRQIKKGLVAGFFPLKIQIEDIPMEIMSYRGTLSGRARGKLGDTYYYDSIAADIVEQ